MKMVTFFTIFICFFAAMNCSRSLPKCVVMKMLSYLNDQSLMLQLKVMGLFIMTKKV